MSESGEHDAVATRARDGASPNAADRTEGGRWNGRPWSARGVRAAVMFVPFVASVLTAYAASLLVPPATTTTWMVLRLVVIAAGATLSLRLLDRLMRRLLPLATLLDLTLHFPDQAPSRYRLALRTGASNPVLEELVDRYVASGRTDVAAAAEHLLELVAALSRHDRITRGHSERVRAYAQMIGEEMGLSATEVDRLRWAALIHDVGKLRTPVEILNKPGSLTDEEYEIVKRHPIDGADLAAPLASWLGDAMPAVVQHHEKWDGTGYPFGLRGTEISRAARIVAVADVFDVLTSVRSYKAACTPADARAELTRCAGTHFDPAVVRAFMNLSLGRLRVVMGPLSWLAQLSLFPHSIFSMASPVGASAAPTTATATAAGGVAGSGVVGSGVVGSGVVGSGVVGSGVVGSGVVGSGVVGATAASTTATAAAAATAASAGFGGAVSSVVGTAMTAAVGVAATGMGAVALSDDPLVPPPRAAEVAYVEDAVGLDLESSGPATRIEVTVPPSMPPPAGDLGTAVDPDAGTAGHPGTPDAPADPGGPAGPAATTPAATTADGAPGPGPTPTAATTSSVTAPAALPITGDAGPAGPAGPAVPAPPPPVVTPPTTAPGVASTTATPPATQPATPPATPPGSPTTAPGTPADTVAPTTAAPPAPVVPPAPGPTIERATWLLGSSASGDTLAAEVLPLVVRAPQNFWLPNLDTDRDGAPGLRIGRGGTLATGDPVRMQRFSLDPTEAVTISGKLRLEVWAAPAEGRKRQVELVAGLVRCNDTTGVCTVLATDTEKWKGDRGDFERRRFDFGRHQVALAADEHLEIWLVVASESQEDLVVAFDAGWYTSNLEVSR
ncbi:MAG: HD-GYP domain-containing protein [Ilumatobacteraceae bacterium]